MFRSKGILWINFAFFVITGSCEFFYKKAGDEVKMDCKDLSSNSEVEWKLNNNMLLSRAKSGRLRKGSSDTVNRARIDRTTLQISPVSSQDSGVYTCGSSKHILSVVTAQANPSTVLYKNETKLSCNVAAGSAEIKPKFQWITPKAIQHSTNKEVNIHSVTSDNAGTWTCKVTDEKGPSTIDVTVEVKVVGPLNTSGEVTVSEGGAVGLPCFLPGKNSLPIKSGLWMRERPPDAQFPQISNPSSVKWNSSGRSIVRVDFDDQERNFSVILKKVSQADAGVYVCTVQFEGGKSLSEKLTLTVLKKEGFNIDNDSKINKNSILHKRFGKLQMWIWLAIAVSVIVLMILVITIVLIYRRNKRMKRKMNKLNSMRQPKNYCKCNRPERQPRAGKKERPPPLPRHAYSSLQE